MISVKSNYSTLHLHFALMKVPECEVSFMIVPGYEEVENGPCFLLCTAQNAPCVSYRSAFTTPSSTISTGQLTIFLSSDSIRGYINKAKDPLTPPKQHDHCQIQLLYVAFAFMTVPEYEGSLMIVPGYEVSL